MHLLFFAFWLWIWYFRFCCLDFPAMTDYEVEAPFSLTLLLLEYLITVGKVTQISPFLPLCWSSNSIVYQITHGRVFWNLQRISTIVKGNFNRRLGERSITGQYKQKKSHETQKEEEATDRKQLGYFRGGVAFQMSQILARTMICGNKEMITWICRNYSQKRIETINIGPNRECQGVKNDWNINITIDSQEDSFNFKIIVKDPKNVGP